MTSRAAQLKEDLRLRRRLLGTFVKTPHPVVVEVLALSGLDCLCIDAEHAPFGRAELNLAILAATAAGIPTLVRVPRPDPDVILNALDLGASGILAPHIGTAAQAAAVVAACRYGRGGRGYAGSTRAARYGTRSLAQNVARGNEETSVVCQIEDADAVANIAEISATEGIDCLFIGPMDLTVSLGASAPKDAIVVQSIEAVIYACGSRQLACGIFTSNVRDTQYWAQRGVNFFLSGSDQQWMLEGASHAVREIKGT